MGRRRIGQETFGFGDHQERRHSPLDDLAGLIDWSPVERQLADISNAAKGEPAWPPLALFKAMLLAVWYDLSDVKLAEALDDRASFRRFCGFASHEATPERTAFVRFRKVLASRGLDKALFKAITAQLKARAIRVKRGTLIDATLIASASEEDGEAHWVKHKGKPAVHGFKAHVGADADTALVEEVAVTPAKGCPVTFAPAAALTKNRAPPFSRVRPCPSTFRSCGRRGSRLPWPMGGGCSCGRAISRSLMKGRPSCASPPGAPTATLA